MLPLLGGDGPRHHLRLLGGLEHTQILGRSGHKDTARFFTTEVTVCPQCVEMREKWVHLRRCMVFGQVGCCNDSKNKHASAHFRADGHALMRSIEPGEDWSFCYLDGKFIKIAD